MHAVLGLSMTPTTVGLVLVEGQDADGVTMDHEAFDVSSPGRSGAAEACGLAAAAVRRTEAAAAARGHRLHSIGVTWSDDADAAASLLLASLAEAGFDNVVPIRLPEATEALARGIAEVTGYQTTAVCVIEPEAVIALIVHTGLGAVHTAVNHSIGTEDDVVRWLTTVFTGADWKPDALVVVGSAGDLEDLMPPLEQALSVPVFTPAEAELALARGAALASASTSEFVFDEAVYQLRGAPRRRRLSQTGPVAMLAAGAVTFVVSLSLAIGLQMAPESPVAEPRAVANTVAEVPVVVHRQAPAPPLEAPVPEVAPVEVAPPAELPEVPAEAPVAVDVPAAPPEAVADVLPPAPDAAAPPPPPADIAPVVPGAPAEKPPLLARILSRIPGLQRGEVPPEPSAVAPPEQQPPVLPPPLP